MERDAVSRRRLLGVLGTAAAGGLAGCSLGAPADDGAAADPGDLSLDSGDPAPDIADLENASFAEVYEAVIDSVAGVRLDTERGPVQGSAWITTEGYAVTNEHVVAEGSGSPSLWFIDEGWTDASVVATDVYSDLAVLEVPSLPEAASPIPLVEEPPAVGTPVAAIGNPYGLTGSFTTGVISGRGRAIRATNEFSIPHTVQTDAAVNPGNSGGPLVTRNGRVAGVVNAAGGDNIGFAISAAIVQRVVPSLIENGNYDHPYMGIGLTDVTPRHVDANDLSVSYGIYVDRVLDGGPAEGVLQGSTGEETVDGVQVSVGGDVVVKLAGQPIYNSDALSSALALETQPGETVDVVIYRDGEKQTVQLTLGTRPDP